MRIVNGYDESELSDLSDNLRKEADKYYEYEDWESSALRNAAYAIDDFLSSSRTELNGSEIDAMNEAIDILDSH